MNHTAIPVQGDHIDPHCSSARIQLLNDVQSYFVVFVIILRHQNHLVAHIEVDIAALELLVRGLQLNFSLGKRHLDNVIRLVLRIRHGVYPLNVALGYSPLLQLPL